MKVKKAEKKRNEGLTLISVIGGGVAGWTVNAVLSISSDSDMTHLYGISIFLGVIVGLLWDIADKLN
ncbi:MULTISPECIES: hypothetical protein [Pontibacillus]|uniref:Uncharacterized protein n=1 Tax=Pontibacillus chungwhensis TaxID=265426 RepID=A0ABY8V1K4_9BACI|nr:MULTISPECIES: hypothetical protein [Pontibacillus]MCD5324572.1 hypothetical protein [Pontibacillus sp. HN14]WIF99132.1 hypothetical protein QNI29_05610 [Pontibacillus chungwhensis]